MINWHAVNILNRLMVELIADGQLGNALILYRARKHLLMKGGD